MRRRYIRLAAMLIALAVVLGEPIGAQEVACNVSYPCWGMRKSLQVSDQHHSRPPSYQRILLLLGCPLGQVPIVL